MARLRRTGVKTMERRGDRLVIHFLKIHHPDPHKVRARFNNSEDLRRVEKLQLHPPRREHFNEHFPALMGCRQLSCQ